MEIGDVERGLIGYWLVMRDENESSYWHFMEDHVCNYIVEGRKMKAAVPGKWRCLSRDSRIILRLDGIDMTKLRTTQGHGGSVAVGVMDFFEKSWFPGEKLITNLGASALKKAFGLKDIEECMTIMSLDSNLVHYREYPFVEQSGKASYKMRRVPALSYGTQRDSVDVVGFVKKMLGGI